MSGPYAAEKALRHRVYKRDGWKCRCPGCKARSNLAAHHVIFRSLGGPDTMWNLITLCDRCHIEGVHGHNIVITISPPLDGSPYTYEWEFFNGWSPIRRIL